MIRNVPRDEWLYNDRGMMKWLGYFFKRPYSGHDR